MCEIIIQKVTKTNIETRYTDILITASDANEFVKKLKDIVSKESAVVVQRVEVQRLADEVSIKSNNELSPKDTFKQLKCEIRRVFEVQRLRFNPRTLVYMGKSKAFILNYRYL